MIEVTRRYGFPAAHVLAHPDLPDEENRRIYGKCANAGGHGHDYGLEVTVSGPVEARSGRVIDPEALDRIVRERVLERLSHRLLNEDPAFRGQVPTTENLSRVIYRELAPAIAGCAPARLRRVAVVETRRNRFSCEEET